MLRPYVPPRRSDAPKIRVPKNASYPLVAPTASKGVQVSQNIMPNLKKLTFVDHDIRKFPELDMKNYVLVQDTPDILKCLVPMEWARGLDQVGLFPLIYMPHLGWSTEVNECV